MEEPSTYALIVHGSALDHLRSMPDDSVDSVVCDPPYGLSNTDSKHVTEAITKWVSGEREFVPSGRGFMSQEWDSFVPPPALWDECLRVLKPGGHLAAFAGSRTMDLMTLSIRLAGFDLRDSLAWIYGSGMPHGQNVGKTVEAHLRTGKSNSRALRAVEQDGDGEEYYQYQKINGKMSDRGHVTSRKTFAPSMDEAKKWHDWNTALKPAFEPIVLARKPLAEPSVARNVLAHGTGALNIGATRIPHRSAADLAESTEKNRHADFGTAPGRNKVYGDFSTVASKNYSGAAGRHPANVVLTHADGCVRAAEDWDCAPGCQVAELDSSAPSPKGVGGPSRFFLVTEPATRFVYSGKARPSERPKHVAEDGTVTQHVSVKPLEVMRWLVRLLTPSGGMVLDPFAGSGTTLEAAAREGFDVVTVERDERYLPLITERAARVESLDWQIRALREDPAAH